MDAYWVVAFALGLLAFSGVARIIARQLRIRQERNSSAGITITPVKAEGRSGFAYSSPDVEQLLVFMHEYHTEVQRIAVGYHQRMMLEGAVAAEQWLERQTGKRPDPPERERR